MNPHIDKIRLLNEIAAARKECQHSNPPRRFTARACEELVRNAPAAEEPPALWTDKPIIGSGFMTHVQGQRCFEIHFQTDSREKYVAVQDECRRQMGHAKPVADVRPVVLCRDCRYYENDCGWCNYIDQDRDQLDWCSRADTREES